MFLDLTLSIAMDDPVVGKASMDQNSFMSAGHVGTHLDSYLQTEIPTEFHSRPGKVVDATRYADAGIDVGIDALATQTIERGDFVIFRTGHLGRTSYGTRDYFERHPQLSWEVIDFLIAREISFIGIDAAGVRRGDEHGVADRRAEDRGTYIIENIANVDQLWASASDRSFNVFTGWTGLKGFSGLQCRIIAAIPSL